MKKLSEHRKENNITQDMMSQILSMSLRNYQRIENNEIGVDISKALLICRLLNISPFDVTEWNPSLDSFYAIKEARTNNLKFFKLDNETGMYVQTEKNNQG